MKGGIMSLGEKISKLEEFLRNNNRSLYDGSIKVEICLRTHCLYGESLKVLHPEIGNYFYADDLNIDLNNSKVEIIYKDYGCDDIKKCIISIK